MKKSNKPDIHQKQGLELSKKLYRATTDHAKRLDDARSCARTIRDLFSPTVQIQRRKFCEYCERLMFSDPSLYGKKAEELLWRKGFYELFTTAKKLKKNEYSQDDVSSIETHILSGVGFYHHLIGRIQQEFEMNLVNVVDFPLKTSEGSESATEWAEGAIHQCLIYLGDLNRYKLEIYPTLEPSLAFRYYLQAISYKPDHGMPHNQMGTLAISQNKFIDAVYYYMRCLACVNTFEGTVNNLHNLFEKLPLENPENFKSFVANFLSLIDVWYFNKKAKVYTLCHQTYKDLEECLNMKSSEPCVSPAETDSTDSTPELLNSDLIFKITTICLLCLHKLQKSNSNQASTAVAFTLAIYSQLVQSVTNHIQDSVLNYPIADDAKIEPNGVVKDLFKKKNASKLRRRKVIASDSDEESDDDLNLSSDSESFEENVLAESSDDETETNDDKTIDVYRKVKLIDVNDSLEIITEEGTLKSIKVINDWLRHDLDVVKSCGTNTRSLFKQITNLLNLINVNVKSPKLRGINLNVVEIIKGENVIPLPEDVVLKGVEMLSKAHKNVDWNYLQKTGVDVKEESVIRIVKFLAFGKFLTTIEETGISFDERANMFVCKCEENEQQAQNVIVEELEELHEVENGPVITSKYDDKETENKGQLMKMKHMGQLWLASEVRALESRVRGKTSLSPYLVLDADALIKYTFMVKHLVHSRKFIVVIPSAVVSALDDLKREQSEARDAIRWLESQFHRGNRFFRAQRPQEKAAIPFIKYPKKKDKEMSTYIHIIECCYFLYEQQKGASNLVTLLIGNQNILTNGENKEFSYVGLAQSAGISIESITEFYGKWKKSYKGKR